MGHKLFMTIFSLIIPVDCQRFTSAGGAFGVNHQHQWRRITELSARSRQKLCRWDPAVLQHCFHCIKVFFYTKYPQKKYCTIYGKFRIYRTLVLVCFCMQLRSLSTYMVQLFLRRHIKQELDDIKHIKLFK
jgi:hypothetical protein